MVVDLLAFKIISLISSQLAGVKAEDHQHKPPDHLVPHQKNPTETTCHLHAEFAFLTCTPREFQQLKFKIGMKE